MRDESAEPELCELLASPGVVVIVVAAWPSSPMKSSSWATGTEFRGEEVAPTDVSESWSDETVDTSASSATEGRAEAG